jgi:hypothetical protein
VLAVAGVLGPGLVVGAIILAPIYLAESVLSWLRFAQERRHAEDADEELE